jgi:AraC family transcriptional regulator
VSNNDSPQHLHLLSSFDAGWDGLNLIYEIEETANEMPETYFGQHFIVIALADFRAHYLLDGRWQYSDYTQGDIAIFPGNQTFPRTQVDRDVPLIELLLDPASLVRIAGNIIDTERIELIPQLQIRDPLIEHMGFALKAELEAAGADSQFYAESMATALSAHLLRRYCSVNKEIKDYRGGLPSYKLRQAISYINEHLDKKLTLAKISDAVQMSSHYFASLFKQSTGLTPHQYVMKCRIDKAKELLLKQDLTLVEICQQVGFENQSHFTRVFRQHAQTTPKAYRIEILGRLGHFLED